MLIVRVTPSSTIKVGRRQLLRPVGLKTAAIGGHCRGDPRTPVLQANLHVKYRPVDFTSNLPTGVTTPLPTLDWRPIPRLTAAG